MAQEEVATETGTKPVEDFGDDDLGRLQGILFGDHARKTNERLATLETALLGAIEDLRHSVESKFSDLEKRLDGEADLRSKAVANVADRVQEQARVHESAQKALRADLDKSHEKTTRAVDDLEVRASRSLEDAKMELANDVETSVQALGDVSVARADLAEALIRAAQEIAGE